MGGVSDVRYRWILLVLSLENLTMNPPSHDQASIRQLHNFASKSDTCLYIESKVKQITNQMERLELIQSRKVILPTSGVFAQNE